MTRFGQRQNNNTNNNYCLRFNRNHCAPNTPFTTIPLEPNYKTTNITYISYTRTTTNASGNAKKVTIDVPQLTKSSTRYTLVMFIVEFG